MRTGIPDDSGHDVLMLPYNQDDTALARPDRPYRSPLITACLVAGAYTLVQLIFLQRYLDYDQVIYAINIRLMRAAHTLFFNPHHLHFEAFGLWFHQGLVQITGADPGDLMLHLRLRSLAFGGIGLVAWGLYIHSLSARKGVMIIGMLLIGGMHAYMHYSAKVDTAIFPAAWLPVMLLTGRKLRELRRIRWPHASLAGLILAVGICMHVYMIMGCVIVALTVLLPGGSKRSFHRILSVLVMTLACLAIIALFYLYTGIVVHGLAFDRPTYTSRTWGHLRFIEWVFAYLITTPYGRGWQAISGGEILRGIMNAILSPQHLLKFANVPEMGYNFDQFSSREHLIFNLLSLSILSVILISLIVLPLLWRRYGIGLLETLGGMAAFSFVAIAIEAHYFEFWI
ncbi:MAG: hypothetical protein KDK34_12580, partial [Leptospiraceae bacterium]|nr:hypothetical protein [Leptospiraceae bacterium]